jgi:hypothetical protein
MSSSFYAMQWCNGTMAKVHPKFLSMQKPHIKFFGGLQRRSFALCMSYDGEKWSGHRILNWHVTSQSDIVQESELKKQGRASSAVQ